MTKYLTIVFVLALIIQGCSVEEYLSRNSYKYKIGMNQQEVLNSIDGAPIRKHKTTTASGTREIWIYAGPSYLYFDERGILRQIDSPY